MKSNESYEAFVMRSVRLQRTPRTLHEAYRDGERYNLALCYGYPLLHTGIHFTFTGGVCDQLPAFQAHFSDQENPYDHRKIASPIPLAGF